MQHGILPTHDALPLRQCYGARAGQMRDHLYVCGDLGHIYACPSITAAECTPLTATIYLSVDATTFGIQTHGCTQVCAAAMLKSVRRRIIAGDARFLIVHLSPLHAEYRRVQLADHGFTLDRRLFAPLDANLSAAYHGAISERAATLLFHNVVDIAVSQLPPINTRDVRGSQWLDRLTKSPQCTLRSLAHEAGLSYEAMSRAVADALGISLRSFQLWMKLDAVRRVYRPGRTLTDIAHAAGFCDLAHMTRIFQRTYGAPPSYFLKNPSVKIVALNGAELLSPRADGSN